MAQMIDSFNKSEAVIEGFKKGKDMRLKKGEDGQLLPPEEQDEDALVAFDKFATSTSYNKETMMNAVPEAATLVGTAGTGFLAGAAINTVLGNPVGKIWKSTKSKDSMPNNSTNPSNSTHPGKPQQTFNDQHSDSFQDNKKYTEEFGESKGKFNTEAPH